MGGTPPRILPIRSSPGYPTGLYPTLGTPHRTWPEGGILMGDGIPPRVPPSDLLGGTKNVCGDKPIFQVPPQLSDLTRGGILTGVSHLGYLPVGPGQVGYPNGGGTPPRVIRLAVGMPLSVHANKDFLCFPYEFS